MTSDITGHSGWWYSVMNASGQKPTVTSSCSSSMSASQRSLARAA